MLACKFKKYCCKAAYYIKTRFVGDDFVYSLRPEVVAGVRVQDLRALQFSTHKAESVVAVAEAIASGKLVQEELAQMKDEDAMQALVALRGIGTWSAEWILVRCLGRARAAPFLCLHTGIKKILKNRRGSVYHKIMERGRA